MEGTKLLIISAIIMLAVACGLLAGGAFSSTFFTGFAASPQGPADDSVDNGGSAASPGFNVKMGSKSGGGPDAQAGGDDSGAETPEETAAAAQTENETTAAPAPSGSPSGGGGGGGGGGGSPKPPAAVACSSDADCPAGGFYSFCSGSDVKVAYGAYTCEDPGTASSSCRYDDGRAAAVLNRTCAYACNETSSSCLTGVYISPPAVNVISGSNFTVDVVISTDESVYAGDFQVAYDAVLLQVEGITSGNFFEGSVAAPVDKSESGLVHYVITKQAVTEGSTGTRSAFTVAFKALARSGSSADLVMTSAELIDENLKKMTGIMLEGGAVNVQ